MDRGWRICHSYVKIGARGTAGSTRRCQLTTALGHLVDEWPTHGDRQIATLLKRERRSAAKAPANTGLSPYALPCLRRAEVSAQAEPAAPLHGTGRRGIRPVNVFEFHKLV